VQKNYLLAVFIIVTEPVISQYTVRYRLLLFTRFVSYPYRHDSISDGVQMFKEMSKKYRSGLIGTADAAIFDDAECLQVKDCL
jgi:hypothetical protein